MVMEYTFVKIKQLSLKDFGLMVNYLVLVEFIIRNTIIMKVNLLKIKEMEKDFFNMEMVKNMKEIF